MATQRTQRMRQFLVATALLAFSSAALADYLCESKEFDPSPQQKELYTKVAVAMRTAFLLPPEGWLLMSPTTRVPSGKFCGDFKNDPVTFGAWTRYVIKPTADELRRSRAAQAAQRAEIDALKVLPPDLQGQVDSLDAQSSALRKESRDAERAKDAALAKSKTAEAVDLSRKAYAIRDVYSVKMRPKERDAYNKYRKEIELSRDRSMRVSIEANGRPSVSDGQAERVVFGAAATKTVQATDKLVRITLSFDRSENFPSVHFETVKKLVDRAKLQAMVAGNIPPLEESRAAVVKQNEAIAQLDAKARELEKSVENEGRRDAEAAQIAKRQAAEAEKAKATKTDAPPDQPRRDHLGGGTSECNAPCGSTAPAAQPASHRIEGSAAACQTSRPRRGEGRDRDGEQVEGVVWAVVGGR